MKSAFGVRHRDSVLECCLAGSFVVGVKTLTYSTGPKASFSSRNLQSSLRDRTPGRYREPSNLRCVIGSLFDFLSSIGNIENQIHV